jgi:hypothetical protein
MADERLGASFRDPSGFVFEREGALHRQVNRVYQADYDHLMQSGLYAELVDRGLAIPHEELEGAAPAGPDAYAILRPEPVDFISYPYEWSFSQLQDAARTTLQVLKTALKFGMTLKDASAYNIQLHRGRPLLIDTLSFERYQEGSPWVGYRQFCQHFLAPLALMAHRDARLSGLLRNHIDGIPLDLARSLLPMRSWLDVHLLLHIRMHARYQARYRADPQASAKVRPLSKQALGNLIAALEAAVSKLRFRARDSAWADYTGDVSYAPASHEHKRRLVGEHLDALAPAELWDLGANTGEFSRIATERGIRTISFEQDPACADRSYRRMRDEGEARLLPLVLDLTNPSPALGWALAERDSLLQRRSADAVLALALVHHLAIANNVPLPQLAAFFAGLAEGLVVEFVPKSDPMVATLLSTRRDVFPDYTQGGFEAAFKQYFNIEEADRLVESERTLYRMRRR